MISMINNYTAFNELRFAVNIFISCTQLSIKELADSLSII